jgi:TolB-like protein
MFVCTRFKIAGLILLIIFVAACSKNVTLYRQASKEYNKAQYEKSLDSSVASLMLKPEYKNAQKLIKKTYPKVIAIREARINQIEAAKEEDMWDKLVAEYTALISIQNKIAPINPMRDKKTGATYEFETKNYETPLAESKLKAAETHYNKGIQLAQSSDNPDTQREAAEEFKTALNYIPNYKDAELRYQQTRESAIKRIAILPFEDKSGSWTKYGSLQDLITDSITSKMLQDELISKHTEVITRDQVEALLIEQQYAAPEIIDQASVTAFGAVLGAHEILTGKIVQINYVAPRVKSVELSESQNMVTGEETYIDDKGKEKTRKIREDVTCVYDKYTKTTSVDIIVSFNLIEVPTGKIKLQETLTAQDSWSDVWGRVKSGKIKLLSDEALDLVSKEEPLPPSEVDMVNNALEDICADIVQKIREYVR